MLQTIDFSISYYEIELWIEKFVLAMYAHILIPKCVYQFFLIIFIYLCYKRHPCIVISRLLVLLLVKNLLVGICSKKGSVLVVSLIYTLGNWISLFQSSVTYHLFSFIIQYVLFSKNESNSTSTISWHSCHFWRYIFKTVGIA